MNDLLPTAVVRNKNTSESQGSAEVRGPHIWKYKTNFNREELEACARGQLFLSTSPRLPSAPLLFLDRVTSIDIDCERRSFKGQLLAELDVKKDEWFFKSHFQNDPLMPGCFLLESLWQLTGFYLIWRGFEGEGRLMDSGRARFYTPIVPSDQTLMLKVNILKNITFDGTFGCVSRGEIRVGNKVVCRCEKMMVVVSSDLS